MVPPPATSAAAAPGAGRVRAAWIDGPRRDLALYIATPLLLIPLILLRSGRPAIQDLILYAGAFGALGHHLPGMMRAYGDRALFRRFRVRFVLAPLFLVPVCVFFSVNDLSGVLLVTFFWTNWHSLMQIFGFARIYDVKVGATGPWAGRLDHALCVAWIGAPLLLSDSRLGSVLEIAYSAGAPLVAPGLIGGLRTFWLGAAVLVTVLWAGHAALAWTRGRAPNPAKLLLFASSFLFWWFCMAKVDNLLVGIALFDIFHDVQYLALVWTFNRARVTADPKIGGFSRYLFRGRATLAGLYVGLVVAYGSLGFLSESISEELVRQTLLGVLAASALLHFYFDGFIWKVREGSTRRALNVAGGGDDIRLGWASVPGWAVHGGKWLFLVVPLGALYWWDVNDTRPERVWREAVLETVPASSEALSGLASVSDPLEDPERVLAMHRRAIDLKPENAVAHNNLGAALFVLGRTDEARRSFLEAVRLFPRYSVAHRHLGSLYVTAGQTDLAARHFEEAIDHDPRDGRAHAGLGVLRAREGKSAQAMALYEEALRLEPGERTALNGLAWLLATHADAAVRDGARAVECAEALVARGGRPDPMVLDTLAAAYAEAGRFSDALAAVDGALILVRSAGQETIAAMLERHRGRYASGQPWRGGR
jgi:Flp pilus assembly protein TadD